MSTATSTNNFWVGQPQEKHPVSREQYERELAERKRKHLDGVRRFNPPWQPCLHDGCPACSGTGVRHDGSPCIHNLSCPCPKCRPYYLGCGMQWFAEI